MKRSTCRKILPRHLNPSGNSAGFSLIEILIAAAVLSFLSLAFGKMIVEISRQTSYLEDRGSMLQFQGELRRMLGNQAVCNENFLNQIIPPPGSEKPLDLKDESGKVRFSTSDPLTNTYDRLNIGSLVVRNEDAAIATKGGKIAAIIRLDRQRKGGGPSTFKELKEILHVAIEGTGPTPFKVTNCVPSSGGNQVFMAQATTGSSVDIHTEDVDYPFAEVTFERRPAPVMITASANIGGGYSDLWYSVRITKKMGSGPETEIHGWPDGIGKKGAATQSMGTFIDNAADSGTVTYKVWVRKMSESKGSPVGGSYIQLNGSRIVVMQP